MSSAVNSGRIGSARRMHAKVHDHPGCRGLRVPWETKRETRSCLPPLAQGKSLSPAGIMSRMLPTEAEISRSAASLLSLTSSWDKGGREVRESILEDFVLHNQHKTGPELERDLGNGASLFLTRLTAWLRLTYLLGRNLRLQYRAISIFVSASSGQRFLTEFMEVGGVLTVLETLGLPQVKEPDKAEGLRLLLHVCNAGRKYKEFICESYGVRAVADCLGKSKSEVTQDYARNLLVQLGDGNPKFLSQVYKALLSLLTSPTISVTSQQMAGQALRRLLPSVKFVHSSIVEATMSLLKSVHVQIQYEGCELLRDLVKRKELQDIILQQLIELLRMDTNANRNAASADVQKAGLMAEEDIQSLTSVIYMHQAHAARLLGSFAATCNDLAEKMISMQVVRALLQTIGNIAHPESQKYAASSLLYLSENFPSVSHALRTSMGMNFYDVFVSKPDTFFRDLTKDQVRYLSRNQVKIRRQDILASRAGEAPPENVDESSDALQFAGGLESADDANLPRERTAVRETTDGSQVFASVEIPAAEPVRGVDEHGRTAAVARSAAQEEQDVKQPAKKTSAKDLYLPFELVKTDGSLSGNKFAIATQQNVEKRYEQELANFKRNQKLKKGQLDPSLHKRAGDVKADASAMPTELRQFDVSFDAYASPRYARAKDPEIFKKGFGKGIPEAAADLLNTDWADEDADEAAGPLSGVGLQTQAPEKAAPTAAVARGSGQRSGGEDDDLPDEPAARAPQGEDRQDEDAGGAREVRSPQESEGGGGRVNDQRASGTTSVASATTPGSQEAGAETVPS